MASFFTLTLLSAQNTGAKLGHEHEHGFISINFEGLYLDFPKYFMGYPKSIPNVVMDWNIYIK